MATQAYWDWINNGRHWQLAKPIADMVTIARRHGIAILGTIGNDEHLEANFPEDHTPFSYTAEPVPANGWVCACDLANEKGLGEAILRDARAGKLPWLKYINFGNMQYGYWDRFRNGEWNSDEHVHLSCFSDDVNYNLGSYDPLDSSSEDEMEQHDPLVNITGRPGRTVGDALGDGLALRDYLIGDGNLPVGYPKPDSPLAKMLAASKGLTSAQVDDIVTRVVSKLEDQLLTREELAPLLELARKLKD